MTLVIYTWPRHGATKMAHLPIAMRQLIFFHIDGRLCLPYHTFYYSKYLQTTACVNSMVMGQYREIFGSRPPVLAEFNNLEHTNLTSPADRPQVLSAQSAALPAPLLSGGKQERRSSYQTHNYHPCTLLHSFQLFISNVTRRQKVWIRLHSSVVSKLYASSYVSRDLLKRHIQ